MSTPPAKLWVCLQCGNLGCNRELKSHGVNHFETSGHSLALQLESKAIWCYSCDSFIPVLSDEPAHVPIKHAIHYITNDLVYRSRNKAQKKSQPSTAPYNATSSTASIQSLIASVNETRGE